MQPILPATCFYHMNPCAQPGENDISSSVYTFLSTIILKKDVSYIALAENAAAFDK